MASARDCEALRSEVSSLEAMRFEVPTYPLSYAASAGEARFKSVRDSEALRSEVSFLESLRCEDPDYPLNDGANAGETRRVLERQRSVAL